MRSMALFFGALNKIMRSYNPLKQFVVATLSVLEVSSLRTRIEVQVLRPIARFSTSLCGNRASAAEILKREVESTLCESGYRYIIGVDEAGRGPIAGPVVAAALVCLPTHVNLIGAADSKALSEKQREEIYKSIKQDPTIYTSFSSVSHTEIDEINILQATMLAMKSSIDNLLIANSNQLLNEIDLCYALIDGNKCPNKLSMKSRPVVRGDALVYPIALASIIAKVERDHIMPYYFFGQYELDAKYPEYGFAQHKGYPTKKHILALHKYGPCEIHRMTFGPCKGRVLPSITGT